MSRFNSAIAMLAMVILAACGQASQATTNEKNQVIPKQPAVMQGSALQTLLSVFASESGNKWDSYRSTPGIVWDPRSPNEYSEGKFGLSGKLVLVGFGSVKLPNGKIGIDYGEVDGNEGQSGVTLNGSNDIVEEISIKKFYFSENYDDILRRQFSKNIVVTKIAGQCAPDPDADVDAKNSFFEIVVAGQKTTYVEAWLEDGGKYSPGYTVFDFQREKPIDRIKEIKCSIL